MGMTAIVGQKNRFYLCNVNERKRAWQVIFDLLQQRKRQEGLDEKTK